MHVFQPNNHVFHQFQALTQMANMHMNQQNAPNVIPNVQATSNAQNITGSGGTGPNMTLPNVNMPNVGGPTQIPGTGQMGNMNQLNPMMNMQHMARGQQGNVLLQGSK